MTVLQRVQREPAKLLGLVAGVTGLCILFGVPLNVEQAGGILTAVGALVGALSYFVTPSSEVVVQEKPDGEVIAGAASSITTGQHVAATVVPVPEPPA